MRDRGEREREREREETRREEGRDERRGEMTSRQRHMRAGPSQQDLSYMVDFDLLMRAGALATDQSYPCSHNLSRHPRNGESRERRHFGLECER